MSFIERPTSCSAVLVSRSSDGEVVTTHHLAKMERLPQSAAARVVIGPFLLKKGAATMRDLKGAGLYKDLVDAPSPQDHRHRVKLGIRLDGFQQYARRGLFSAIAQYYGIVQDGLLLAQHCFRGLNRPLMLGDDVGADESVLIYTWRSAEDYEWAGTPQYGRPQPINPPAGIVFVVLVREETPDENGVIGSIEHWNWVREDPNIPHAPVDWRKRYGSNLWSK